MRIFLQLILLIVFVGLHNSVSANRFVVESFKQDPTDLTAQSLERTDNFGKQSALIKVSTEIDGLSFEADNAIIGNLIRKPDGYWIYVSAGVKRLRILKRGFISLDVMCSDYNVKIVSSGVYDLKVKPENPEGGIDELLGEKGDLNLISKPSGAIVTIEGDPDFLGLTPFLYKGRKAGVFKISFQKDFYSTKDTLIQIVPDTVTTVSVSLEQPYGFILFNVTPVPPAVNIYIDGRLTPGVRPGKVVPVSKGEHILQFSAANCVSQERKIVSALGRTDTVTVDLKPIMGSLTVNVTPSTVSKAEIWINNRKTEYYAPAKFPYQIGDYNISLKKQGYPETIKPVTLNRGSNTEVSFTMYSFDQLKQVVRSRQIKQNIWMASAAAFGTMGGYLIMDSNTKYTQYQEATGSRANALHSTIESHQKIGAACIGVALFSAIEFTVQLNKKGKEKHQLIFGTNENRVGLKASF